MTWATHPGPYNANLSPWRGMQGARMPAHPVARVAPDMRTAHGCAMQCGTMPIMRPGPRRPARERIGNVPMVTMEAILDGR